MGTDGAPLGAVGLAIPLFLFFLRRTGERAGRLAERLDTTERADAIHRRMLEAAARRPHDLDELVRRLLGGRFEPSVAVCPPGEVQARAADELPLLSEDSAVAEMLSDYAVMREQVRACRSE